MWNIDSHVTKEGQRIPMITNYLFINVKWEKVIIEKRDARVCWLQFVFTVLRGKLITSKISSTATHFRTSRTVQTIYHTIEITHLRLADEKNCRTFFSLSSGSLNKGKMCYFAHTIHCWIDKMAHENPAVFK